MEDTETLLLSLASVVALGVSAQWLAWRLRVPSILLLLAFGFLAGPVTGLVDPDLLFGDLLFPFVSLSVGLILFEGGLSLRLPELKGSGRTLWLLVSVGAVVSWALTTVAAYGLLPMDLQTSLLLGAILVVTGPTVVLPLLRHIRPVGRVATLAKWEGIVIDPIGAVLAVLVFEAQEAIHSAGVGQAIGQAAAGLVRTVLAGGALGAAAAVAVVQVMRRYWVPDFLQSPLLLMAVATSFTAANLLQEESGLLAATVMGVALANQQAVSVRHIVEFKENLRVLLISTLFILLAARLEIREMAHIGWPAALLVALLVLVVRPASVLAATAGSALDWRERAFLAWMAPRGIVAAAVASVFALRLGDAGRGLLPATFAVIVGTVAVYGLTAPLLARRLGLSKPNPQGIVFASAHPGARAIAHAVKKAGFPVLLVDNNRTYISAARMEGLPTHFTSVLSEEALDGIEQGGMGRLLALTPNDEVNALAAVHFRDVFGRSEVYQLPSHKEGHPRTEFAPIHARGRTLFAAHATFEWIDQRFAAGAIVKTTRLSKEFDYEAFRAKYGETALPLFLLTENGELLVATVDRPFSPRPGQSLISLADRAGEAREETA